MKNELFKKKTSHFIETGSFRGDGIQLAIESGFDFIYSIELSLKYFEGCKYKFKNNPNVQMIFGDSSLELPKLLKENKNPFTYWLDGHYSGDDTAKGSKDSPLIEELTAIFNRKIDGEIIYIDDMRLYRNFDKQLNMNTILQLIKKHKSFAKIHFEKSNWDSEDIMVIEY